MSDDPRVLKMARHYYGERALGPDWMGWREEALEHIRRIEAAGLVVTDPDSCGPEADRR